MLDRDWPAPMDLTSWRLERPGLRARIVDAGPMVWINGDIAAALREAGLERAHGWPGESAGPRHALRLGFDRALCVGAEMATGWRGAYGVSAASDALIAFEMTGEAQAEALKRLGEIAFERPSASCAFLALGFRAILHRHDGALRILIARPLAEAFAAHLEAALI